MNLDIPAPSLLAANARAMSDSALFAIISDGRGGMPAYGWAIPSRERLGVIAYLRTLQRTQLTRQ